MNIDQDKWLKSVRESKNPIIIDVRTPEEFVEGYIENAVNLNIYNSNNFLEEIQKFDKKSASRYASSNLIIFETIM